MILGIKDPIILLANFAYVISLMTGMLYLINPSFPKPITNNPIVAVIIDDERTKIIPPVTMKKKLIRKIIFRLILLMKNEPITKEKTLAKGMIPFINPIK